MVQVAPNCDPEQLVAVCYQTTAHRLLAPQGPSAAFAHRGIWNTEGARHRVPCPLCYPVQARAALPRRPVAARLVAVAAAVAAAVACPLPARREAVGAVDRL